MEALPGSKAVTYLGRTNTMRNVRTFGIRQRDRRSHMAIFGKTGTGKSALLQNIVCPDVLAGRGGALLDPHGDLVRAVFNCLPERYRQKVVTFDAGDPSLRYRFNPFADTAPDRRALAAAGLVEVFKKIWSDDWGPRLEHLLRNVVFTLLERPDSSLADIPRLTANRSFRSEVVADIEDKMVKEFWTNEFDKYSPGFRSVVVAPLQNKIRALLTDPTLRSILREAMHCLAGPLVLRDNETGEEIEDELPPSIGVVEDPVVGCSGPLWIRGGIVVESADGTECERRNRVTLRRCGASANKPFCNGSNASVMFDDGRKHGEDERGD